MKIDNLIDKTWKKCLIIFVVIFIVVFCIGFISVGVLDSALTDSHIHTISIVVADKFISNNTYDDYIVIDSNNKTYVINNDDNNYDKRMYDSIKVGNKYEITIRDPAPTDINQIIYILQVHNAS